MRRHYQTGRALARLNATVEIEEDIPILGIRKGTIDVQRFFHWNIMKCFWNDDFDFFTNKCDQCRLVLPDPLLPLHTGRNPILVSIGMGDSVLGRARRRYQLPGTKGRINVRHCRRRQTRFDRSTVNLLRHRGPDQTDLVHERLDESRMLTFGQTRLNVVDQKDISLPVRRQSATILFNGEIYNWLEIRQELEGLELRSRPRPTLRSLWLHSNSGDPRCLTRFNGMFAIAIWDGERFFCARDRMGKKPLFYRLRGDCFEFASEIKAFSDRAFVGNEIFDLFESVPTNRQSFATFSA